jgi:hypothetical protein
MHIVKKSSLPELKEKSPTERRDMIKFSIISSRLRYLKEPDGLEWFLSSEDFTQDDKDYILFNINSLEELSKLRYLDFKNEVLRFKERTKNA